MKIIFLLLVPLLLFCCKGEKAAETDPRSAAYNDRAIEKIQHFMREGTPDTTGLAQAGTRADSARVLFKNIVDSCQILLDSAVMYSPDHYLYYSQKAMFYAYCADYRNSYKWIVKALEKKDIPEIRLYTGMLLYKMGKENQAQEEYAQVIRQYEKRDTLSDGDVYNYAFALSLIGEKEKAAQVIGTQIKDTLLKKELSGTVAGGKEIIDAMMP